MAFKRSADGIAKKGKTDGKNLGDSGPSLGAQKGPGAGNKGKLDSDMLKLGRNRAKIAAQKRG